MPGQAAFAAMMRILLRLLALPVLLVLAVPTPGSATERFDPFAEAGITPLDSPPLPADLRLMDSRGQVIVLGDYIDGKRPLILAPVYYDCPNICGLSTESLLHGLAQAPLSAETDYRVVFVSFDPTEGPAEARASRDQSLARLPALRGTTGDDLAFLSGQPADVRRLLEAIGYRIAWDPELGQYAHANAFAVVTPDGTVSRWINAIAATPLDLRLALVEAGRGAIGSASDFVLMMCYRYDPKTGQYGTIIDLSLKTMAGLLVFSLGGFIGRSLWRERRGRRSG